MNRREFLRGATLAGTAGLVGVPPSRVAAEPPPETATLRLEATTPGVCNAPQFFAEDLFRSEGFVDLQYVKRPRTAGKAVEQRGRQLASGEISVGIGSLGPFLAQIDAGDPIVIVSGIHIGCFALFATDRIRTIRDLNGKAVSVTELGSGRHLFLSAAMSYVGLDPRKDVQFAEHSPVDSMRLLAEGKIDGYQAFSEEVAELRARKIGRVILDGTNERPWSQYFCCMVVVNRDFARKYPIATKRARRAILKATDVCGTEPERVARFMVDKGYTPNYDYAQQTLRGLPYDKWRTYDPEDTIRFWAVRLREAGIVKATPQKLVAQGTDWRFLNELKKELKG